MTIPILGMIFLYLIGTVYHYSFYTALGFTGYTGSVDINQILLVNINSLVLIGATMGNGLGLLFLVRVMVAKSDIIETAKADMGSAAIKYSEFKRSFVSCKIESIATYILLLPYFGLLFYHFIWGNSINGWNMVLGIVNALLILLVFKAKTYDLKWMFGVIVVFIFLAHAQTSGYIDARKAININKIIQITSDGDTVEGIYVSQDTDSFYILSNGDPILIRKETSSKVKYLK